MSSLVIKTCQLQIDQINFWHLHLHWRITLKILNTNITGEWSGEPPTCDRKSTGCCVYLYRSVCLKLCLASYSQFG